MALYKILLSTVILTACTQRTSDLIVDAHMSRDGTCYGEVINGVNAPWQDPARGFSLREEHTNDVDRCIIEHSKK